MATTFERITGRIIITLLTMLIGYMLSVGIYTVIYGNSFLYNFGYTIGYVSKKFLYLF